MTNQIPQAKTTIKTRAEEHGLLPGSAQSILASYPERPAAWLEDCNPTPPSQEDIDALGRAVLAVLKDGHREAVVKCLHIWSSVQAGTLSTSAETISLLREYPNDITTRDAADSVVRAMWSAHKGLLLHEDKGYFDLAIRWAKTFWSSNSVITHCLRRQDIENNRLDTEAESDDPLANNAPLDITLTPTMVPDNRSRLHQQAIDLFASYVEALETSPANLYDHEKQEVHAGLVAGVSRDVITALNTPELWCMEHGAHIVRSLIESRIYIQWMAQQSPAIYRHFQEYGAGKAKLYARIFDELPTEARKIDFKEGIEELERLSHNDATIDIRTVDTRDSFAEGKTIRNMAKECGLLDLYRQAYSIASGVSHSEWWSLETHTMERCLNVLHGGHLIPSLSLNPGGNVELARSWLDQLYTLMQVSMQILDTNKDAVKNAFSWLMDDQEHDSQDSLGSPPQESQSSWHRLNGPT
ncbi:DUF5677 domain-containing protein [Actinophytocola sediminis]